MHVVRWLLAWMAAVLVTGVLGSIVQTQFNLARIAALDEPITWSVRLETTLSDLAGFAPAWMVITGLGLLIALLVAGWLGRRWPRWNTFLHALAGFLAVAAALSIMNAMLPVTPVAAARTWAGFVWICLPGAIGGWMYSRMLGARPQNG